MSDDLELGFNSTPLEQGVRRADRALKELEDALQRLETSASKFRNTQDTEFNNALKAVRQATKKQVSLLDEAQQNALEVIGAGNLSQLKLVREQNRAVQALYEVRLATTKKLGVEELRWWKEQGANLGSVQKLQLKQFDDTTKALASAQMRREAESRNIVANAGRGLAALQQKLDSDRLALVAKAGKGVASLLRKLSDERLAIEAREAKESQAIVANAGRGLAALRAQQSKERLAAAAKEAAELKALQTAYSRQTFANFNASLGLGGGYKPKSAKDSFAAFADAGAIPDAPKKVKQTADLSAAMRKLGDDTGYAHSMARGLASGFNLLWLTWGSLAPLFAGAAISNSFVQVAKTGMAVEHTFAVIQHLGENSAESVALLRGEMEALGKSGPFAPLEIAEAMKTLSLAGLKANEILAVTKDVLNFSVAGSTNLTTAAETLVAVTTAFGMGAAGFGRVADVISKAAADSMASVESFSESMKAASVINKQYGVSLEDTATGIAALSNLGIKGSAAGTALRNMYADLSGRSIQVAKVLKKVGIEMRDVTTGGMRPMIEVVAELDQKFRNFTAIGQKNLMQALLSERGAKPIVELLQMIRQEATLMNGDLSSALAKANESIANSAGFAAVTAAKMAQTTENRFKALKATLATSMEEAYKAMQPSLYLIIDSLKQAFGSQEFINALSTLVGGIATLTKVLVENSTVVMYAAGAYMALKTVQALLSTGAGLYAAATAALTAKKVVDTATTVAQTAAEANLAKTRAMGVVGLARFIPGLNLLVGAVTAGWIAYSFWREKSNDADLKASELYNNNVIKDLRDQRLKLEEINKLRATGISLQEAEQRIQDRKLKEEAKSTLKPALAAISQLKAEEAAAYSKLLRLEKSYAEFSSVETKRQIDSQKKLAAGATARTNAAIRQHSMSSAAIENETELLKRAAEQRRKDDAAEAKRRADDMKGLFGDKPFELGAGGRGGAGGFEPTNRYTEAIRDNIAALNAQADAEIRASQARYNSSRQVLEAQQQANLISEGSYQMQLIALTEQSEAERLAVLQRSNEQIQGEFTRVIGEARRVADSDISNSILKGSELSKYVAERYKTLGEFITSTSEKTTSELAKNEAQGVQITEEAFMRRRLAAIKYAGEIRKIQDEQRDYWRTVDDERAQQAGSDELSRVTRDIKETGSARAKAAIAAIEAANAASKKHMGQLRKLEKESLETGGAVSDAFEAMWDVVAGGGEISVAMQQQYDAFVKRQKTVTTELGKFKIAVEQDVAQEAARAYKLSMEAAFLELRGRIEDVLMTAIFEGGKAGKQKLKNWLLGSFKNMVLEVAVRPIATGWAGFIGQLMGIEGGGGSGGSSLGGIINTIKMGSDVYSSMGMGGAGSSALIASGMSYNTGFMSQQSMMLAAQEAGMNTALIGSPSSGFAGYAPGIAGAAGAYGFGKQYGVGGGIIGGAGSAALAGGVGGMVSGAGFASGATGALAGLGPWGWAAIAILAILGSMDDSGTYHTGGAGKAGKSGVIKGITAESLGFADTVVSEQTTTAMEDTAKGLAELFNSLNKGDFTVSTAFADDSSKDKSWGAFRIERNGEKLLDWQDTQTSKWAPKEFADGEAGLKAYNAALAVSVRDALTQIGLPEWATDILKAFGDAPTFEQISGVMGAITQVDHTMKTLGMGMTAFANISDAAVTALAEAVGGIGNLQQSLSFFYQEFFSEEERTRIATAQTSAEFDKLGKTMPKTRDEFKDMVNAAIAAGDTELAADLLALSGAVASVLPPIESLTKSFEELADEAMSALQKAIDREKAYWQKQLDAAEELKSEVSGIFDLLVDNIRELRQEATNPVQYAQGGNRFINNAITVARAGGGLPNQDELANAISAARGGLGMENFVSVAEQRFAQLELAGRLEILKNVAGEQLTEAERQIRIAQSMLEQLERTQAYWEELLDIQLNGVDATLSVAEAVKQIAAILDPTGAASGGSGGDLVVGGQGGSKPGTSGGSGGFTVGGGGYGADVYATEAERLAANIAAFEAAGKGYSVTYLPGVGPVVIGSSSPTSLSDTQEKWLKDAGVPGFASGGSHSGGWAVVGEEGPELAFMPPARIYNAGQTSSMLSGGSDESQLAEVVYELKMLRDQVAVLNRISQQSADALNGQGQQPMLVEVLQ